MVFRKRIFLTLTWALLFFIWNINVISAQSNNGSILKEEVELEGIENELEKELEKELGVTEQVDSQLQDNGEEESALGFKNPQIGLGLSLFHQPQDSAFKRDGNAIDLFFDFDLSDKWLKFRLGYNSTSAKSSLSAFNKTFDSLLSTTSIYTAWRYDGDLELTIDKSLKLFGIAGLAMLDSKLETNQGAGSLTSSAVGLILGGGTFYNIYNKINVGSQFQIIYGTGSFEGIPAFLGFSQFQVLVSYVF